MSPPIIPPKVCLFTMRKHTLLLGNLDRTIIDTLDNVVGVLPVNGASNGLGGSEDLLDGTGKVLGKGLVLHLSGDLNKVKNDGSASSFFIHHLSSNQSPTTHRNDLVEGNVTSVLDVLLLLSVSRRLLQGLDDQTRCRGDDADLGLTVLDGQLDGDSETLPVTGGLGDIFTDLLGGL